MKKFFPSTLAKLALGATFVTLFTWSARAEDADISTPKKAALAFAKAVDAGDLDAAKKLATGGDTEWKLISALSEISRAMAHLRNAVAKQFGEKGQLPPAMMHSMTSEFEHMDEKIEGDKATLAAKGSEEKFPPTLKKTEKGWQMDLTNLSADPGLATAVEQMQPAAKRLDAVATEVEAGKYKSMEEVMGAVRKARTGE